MQAQATLVNHPEPDFNYRFEADDISGMRECLAEHGFFIAKDVISEATATRLRRLVEDAAEAPPQAGKSITMFDLVERQPEVLSLLGQPKYLKIITSLMGTEEISLHRSSGILRAPGAKSLPWHTDYCLPVPEPRHRDHVLNAFTRTRGGWFYLTGSCPEQGGLAVIRNSNKPDWPGPEGFSLNRPLRIITPPGDPENYQTQMDMPGAFPLRSNPTDLIIYDIHVWHTNHPHIGDQLRVSLSLVWRPRDLAYEPPWQFTPTAHKPAESAPEAYAAYVRDYRGVPADYWLPQPEGRPA